VKRLLLALTAAVLAAAAAWLKWRPPVVELAAAAFPFAATGQAASIEDGDTFVLVADAGQGSTPARVKVRLHGIDAPELVQRHGWAAREALADLTRDRPLRVDCYKADARGRAVCRVFVLGAAQEQDLELALLRAGHAWHYRSFAAEQAPNERADYASAEAQARTAGRGLWQAPGPSMPPWTCRERLRDGLLCD
jgi:endonuclease YncB( thermonuclease family)